MTIESTSTFSRRESSLLLKTGRTFRGTDAAVARPARLEFRDEESRGLTRRFFPDVCEPIIRVVLIRSESSGPRNARRHATLLLFSSFLSFRLCRLRFLVSPFRPACPLVEVPVINLTSCGADSGC